MNYKIGTGIQTASDHKPQDVTAQTTTIAMDKQPTRPNRRRSPSGAANGLYPRRSPSRRDRPSPGPTTTARNTASSARAGARTRTPHNESWSHTFNEVGSFDYHCGIHPDARHHQRGQLVRRSYKPAISARLVFHRPQRTLLYASGDVRLRHHGPHPVYTDSPRGSPSFARTKPPFPGGFLFQAGGAAVSWRRVESTGSSAARSSPLPADAGNLPEASTGPTPGATWKAFPTRLESELTAIRAALPDILHDLQVRTLDAPSVAISAG